MPRPREGYYHPDTNKRLVGVTTPIGMLKDSFAMDNLLDWAQELALNYEDGQWKPKYWKWARNQRGLIGSEGHALSIGYVTHEVPDVEDIVSDELYTPELSKEALEYYVAFAKWWDRHRYYILAHEMRLINKNDGYGGTPDLILEGMIADIKTGFVNEYICAMQLAAYAEAWRVNNGNGEMFGGLIIGFNKDKEVIEYPYTSNELREAYKDFLKMKELYYSQQEFMKRRGGRR